ncbi:3-dehydroquinate synthase [Oscillatoria sp. FACHB-1406]|uniref:3-dehydroquinate synthase n=1 Tax=Oscillatoria sp. FACHB-1406 TaxID=2692846 RepID=UPI00168728A5|nr:3-dehydroquinate synthase [Oscillatoria sp. FACHB-1406]MBD2579064.1 3-dehydroquinate synthase [Oscillatoria sp. FACHB-1406]
MSSTIRVALPDNSYDLTIAPGLLDRIGAEMSQLKLGKKVLLVSNPAIFKLYGDRALKSLKEAGFDTSYHLIPPGERYKTLNSIQKVYDTAIEKRLERSSTLVALGGGVIGDMTGFAAATWLRGINFVQVPTSLLAMVDASIGGKTGVNHPQGKNLIGAFYQPKWVAIDPNVLETLPSREFRAGMAEVIKYGVIWDVELFEKLEAAKHLDRFRTFDPELLNFILLRSCQAKADVVGKDEKEAGLRAILNYGHTIGHAIESLTGYRSINHGEAVGIGMVAAGEIALALEIWTETEAQRQQELIIKAGLPVKIPANVEVSSILTALELDKKVKGGRVRFILPTRLGEVTMSDRVSPEILLPILQHSNNAFS